MSVETTVTTKVTDVEYLSCWWGDLEFRSGDHTVKVSLTDDQLAEMAVRLTKRALENKERAAKKAKELLEEQNEDIDLVEA